jgi:hypothetical protein
LIRIIKERIKIFNSSFDNQTLIGPFAKLMMASLIFVVSVLLCAVSMVAGHGRLIKPPSRSSAWRYGFNTPANYNDHELFCGGFAVSSGIDELGFRPEM